MRKEYFQHKLTEITNRVVSSFCPTENETESFCADIDRNIKLSRQIFSDFDSKFEILTEDKWTALMKKVSKMDF